MLKKTFLMHCTAALCMLVFLCLAPVGFEKSRVPLTQQHSGQTAAGYKGVVYVWHIAGFKPYRGSLGSWVAGVAAQIEDKYRGVFFEVESITPEECSERISRGERADVYSFPLGWAYPEDLRKIDVARVPSLRGNLAGCGMYRGEIYAYPYAASGYVLIANQRLMQEEGIQDGEMLEKRIIAGETVSSGNAAAFAVYGGNGELLSREDFMNENAAVLFGDARDAGDISRKLGQGKGFPYETYTCSNYSDLVQCMGADDTVEDEKIPVIAEFIERIYAIENQSTLCDLGLVSAAVTEEVPEGQTETEEQLFLQLESIAAPNAFLFKTYRDQLMLSAYAAAEGDSSAKKDFDLRLIELVQGADIK